MIWTLRFKHRQHLQDVQIETETDSAADAATLAAYYVRTTCGDNGRVVLVKPMIAITTAQMLAATQPAVKPAA